MSDHESDANDPGVEVGGGWASYRVTKKELRAQKRMEDLEDLFEQCISNLKSMIDELDDPGAFKNRRTSFEKNLKIALDEYDRIHG